LAVGIGQSQLTELAKGRLMAKGAGAMWVRLIFSGWILWAALASGAPSNADELLAGDLYSFCVGNDQMSNTACRFYVLGVVQGVGLGDGTTTDPSGKQMVERKKTIFCAPDDFSQTQMVSLVRDLLALDFKRYPEDKKLAAAGMVAGIFHTRFPCPR
jgi:Rap1a immunity proteins